LRPSVISSLTHHLKGPGSDSRPESPSPARGATRLMRGECATATESDGKVAQGSRRVRIQILADRVGTTMVSSPMTAVPPCGHAREYRVPAGRATFAGASQAARMPAASTAIAREAVWAVDIRWQGGGTDGETRLGCRSPQFETLMESATDSPQTVPEMITALAVRLIVTLTVHRPDVPAEVATTAPRRLPVKLDAVDEKMVRMSGSPLIVQVRLALSSPRNPCTSAARRSWQRQSNRSRSLRREPGWSRHRGRGWIHRAAP